MKTIYKRRLFTLSTLLLFVISITPTNTAILDYDDLPEKQAVLSEAWLSGFDRRKSVSITGSVGAGTNYMVMINVTYDSDMQTDLDDVRFTTSDGLTILDHWRQNYTDSAYGIFWVEVTDNLNSSTTIYMYYGNPTATDASDGDATFLDFYDKDDTSGWTESNIAVSTSGDYLRFYNPTGSSIGLASRYDLTIGVEQWALMYQMKTVSLHASDDTLGVQILDGSPSDKYSLALHPHYNNQTEWFHYNGSVNTIGLYAEGLEYIFEHSIDETDSAAGIDYAKYATDWTYQSGVSGLPFAYGTAIDADGLAIGDSTSGGPCDGYFRFIAFRKYIDSEPYVASFGSEESETEGDSWLTGYYYRTKINLNGSVGAGTNYVLKWTVEYGSGTDSGQTVYCSSNCQPSFGDIRFTDNDGETELNYYLDEYTSGDDATFYVQIADNLDYDQAIYMYYGTAGTSYTTSSGIDTFDVWLDHSNTTGWYKTNMIVSDYAYYLRFVNTNPVLTGTASRTLAYPADQWRMITRMLTYSQGSVDSSLIRAYDGSSSHLFTNFQAPRYADQNHYSYWNGSQIVGGTWVEGEEYVVQITVDESDSSAGVDYEVWQGNMQSSISHISNEFYLGTPTDANGIIITDGSGVTEIDMRARYIAVMKNIDSEPFAGSYEEGSGENPQAYDVYVRAYDEDSGTYTDDTLDANDEDTSDVPLIEHYSESPEVNDAMYFGSSARFRTLIFDISTQGVGAGWSITWEYYNETSLSWVALSDVVDETNGFLQEYGYDLEVTWTVPSDWGATTIDGTTCYWVRARVTSFYGVSFQPKADIITRVLWDIDYSEEWGLNAFFIILGLCMIPASSLYLVRGGKNELSQDKLYMALIAFAIGWALLVGGIMP